jgi:outer membrane protein OmpA-like peptidoglycan-associated protein
MKADAGVITSTDGGVSGLAEVPEQVAASVAPATAAEFNTLRASIKPFACWKIDDVRFAVDSSVVAPDVKEDLASLHALIRKTTTPQGAAPLLSIFGHADPTGADSYNKTLSGRRARSIYALLTHKVDIWEKLADDAEGTNDRWGSGAAEIMSTALGRTPSANANDKTARAKLFRDYMDFLCKHENPAGDLLVAPSNFLGKGADANGKADFQGCGEHNPLLLLSTDDENTLTREERAELNGANRRVTVLLFKPGTVIDLGFWPCPTADQGPAGCQLRFFQDHEQRKKPHATEQRRFDTGGETFRCRFYESMSTRSPCETPSVRPGHAFLAVRVFFHTRPMKGLAVRFSAMAGKAIGDELGAAVLTDDTGLAVFPRTVPIGNYACAIEYQHPQLVTTVFDKARPETLVLPIRRPHLHVGGDIEFKP